VFGFSSSKFDMNLLNKYLNSDDGENSWHIMEEGLTNGGVSKFQKVKVKHDKTGIVLVFLDAKRFVESGSLADNVRSFGTGGEMKGMCPYEKIDKKYVMSTEIFPLEDFYSELKRNLQMSKIKITLLSKIGMMV
jgi:hypothetical protein